MANLASVLGIHALRTILYWKFFYLLALLCSNIGWGFPKEIISTVAVCVVVYTESAGVKRDMSQISIVFLYCGQ